VAWQGIIFDLNGVLLWDGALQEEAWARFSAAVRGRALSPGEMAIHVHGRNNRYTLEYLLSRPLSGDELERLSEAKEEYYRGLCLAQGRAEFRLSPGAASLLDWLAAHGIPRAIATASGRANVDFFREHLGLDRWFDQALVYDDGTLRGKPAPDLYLRAAGTLGLAPAGCVVVEDSVSGLEAARAAGTGLVVARGPPGSHAALAALPGVSLVIESLADLPARELFAP